MTFTPEQIAIIEQIVDRRILMNKTKQRAQTRKPYHTAHEIRQLIVDHLPALKEELGDGEFDIAVLRHCISKKTTLLDADLEILGTGDSRQPRWEIQTLNALNPTAWPDSPIIPGSRRRSYRFAHSNSAAASPSLNTFI